MNPILANPLLDKPLWVLIAIIAFVLFLGTVACCVLLIRQKRYKMLLVAILALLLAYFLFQCFCAYAGNVPDYLAVTAVTAWFAALPSALLLLVCALLALVELLFFKSIIAHDNTRITPASVKEATDTLPMGICAYLPGQQLLLTNQAIAEFCEKATGNVLFDGAELAQTLHTGKLAPGCKKVMLGDAPVFVLADNTAWTLAEEIIADAQEDMHLLMVSDITAAYDKTLKLRAVQDKVSALNQQLARVNREIVDLTAAQEVLSAKIKIHDELGSNLLSIRRYLQSGGSKAQRDEIVQKLRQHISFLQRQPQVAADEYELIMQTAAQLGVHIVISGTLPQREPCKHILATAMHECLTNMLRHAGGDELRILLREDAAGSMALISNNGRVPDGEIREKGGWHPCETW